MTENPYSPPQAPLQGAASADGPVPPDTKMNWKRVTLFVVALFGATAAASFPFGFVIGFLEVQGQPPPSWIIPGQAAANFTASCLVFGLLAKRQTYRCHAHAWAVLLGSWIASYPLNVLLLGAAPSVWAASVVFLAVALFVGVALGSRLRAPAPGPVLADR